MHWPPQGGCDAPSQKVGATPSSRKKRRTLLLVGPARRRGVAGTPCDGGVAATRRAVPYFMCMNPVKIKFCLSLTAIPLSKRVEIMESSVRDAVGGRGSNEPRRRRSCLLRGISMSAILRRRRKITRWDFQPRSDEQESSCQTANLGLRRSADAPLRCAGWVICRLASAAGGPVVAIHQLSGFL